MARPTLMRAGMPSGARHGHVERGVFVAVAHLGAQHFLGRRHADGGLLVEQAFTSRTSRSARARAPVTPFTMRSASAIDLGVVALEERLGLQVARQRPHPRPRPPARAGRARRARARRRSACCWPAGTPPCPRRELAPSAASRRWVRSTALAQRGHDGGGLQHVGPHAARHGQLPAPARRLAHRHEAERALFAHDLAGVGDPRGGREAREAICTLKAGIGRPPATTTSRLPTSTTTGALLSVAGSNTISWWRAPAVRPPLARRRARLSISAGGSFSVRAFGARAAGRRDPHGEASGRRPCPRAAAARCPGRARSRTTARQRPGRRAPSS